jgi:lysozyme family protein
VASFNLAFPYLMNFEDSHPVSGRVTTDWGGLTKYGISQKAYPGLSIPSLTIADAEAIYLKDYWRFNDVSSQVIANKLFQIAVNLGFGGLHKICVGVLGAHPASDVNTFLKAIPLSVNTEMINLINDLSVIYTVQSVMGYFCAFQLDHYIHEYGDISKVPGGLVTRARE